MPLSKKQKELAKIADIPFYDEVNDKLINRTIVVDGGVRSGKTLWASTIGFFELCYSLARKKTIPVYVVTDNETKQGFIDYKDASLVESANRFMVASNASSRQAYYNVTSRINQYAKERGFIVKRTRPQNDDFTYRKGNVIFTIETYALPTNDSWEQYTGASFRSVFIDEASLISKKNIEYTLDRTISFADGKAIMVCNPAGSDSHWFYQEYIKDHQDKSILYYHFTLIDNPIIHPSVVENYRKIYSQNVFDQRILGKWIANEGSVYKKLPEISYESVFDFIYFGIDYGEADATSCVAVGFKNENYYIIDQYYHSNRKNKYKQNSINDYAREIKNFMIDTVTKYNVKANAYVETTPLSMYNLLSRELDLIRLVNIKKVDKRKVNHRSKSAIQERIDITNMLINANRLFILDKELPVFKAFDSAVYGKDNNRLDDGSTDIDSLDSFEYAIKVDFKRIMKSLNVE